MSSSADKIKLKSFDSLFGTNETAKESSNDIIEVELKDLYPYKQHPFLVNDDERLEELTKSITENGVLVPGIARMRPEGGYELISGHTRRRACLNAGLKTMPIIVKNLTDDEAAIVMVDANIQRENILPSEKAKAYRIKYDAMKHQGKIGNSLEAMSEEAGESAKKIQRYIWISRLNEYLLGLLDTNKLGFTQATALSFIGTEAQAIVQNALEENPVKITTWQAENIKNYCQNNESLADSIEDFEDKFELYVHSLLYKEEEKMLNRKVTIKESSLREFFDPGISESEIQATIFELLTNWKANKEASE